ncbi:MAG: putative tryptophan/tyrosine transport system substrate-binding protein [Candidatus Dependentiae bacterium]|nr:putative tryptophan/tyrosine transport system substrate-binding protein [Candidatus Dependentiae bacterium]
MHHRKSVYFQTILILFLLAVGMCVIKYKITRSPHYTIGLVYVPSRAFHEYLGNAFVKKIKNNKSFSVHKFTSASSSDLILVNATCNEALESDADILVCVGLNCVKGALKCAQKRESKKPIVFMGVADVVKHGFVKSIGPSGSNVAGVESNSPFEQIFNPVDLLHAIKEKAKNVLVPYAAFNPETLEDHAQTLQAASKKISVSVTLLPIDQFNDVLPKTAGLLLEHDTLLYLEQDGIAVCGPGLGKLASQHNVTMFAGSIDGIKDSALSYAADPACLADMAFEIAKEILINKKKPGDIPVRQATVPRNLIINTKLCEEQDLADIDIPAVVHRIRADTRFAAVHDHIIVDGVVV